VTKADEVADLMARLLYLLAPEQDAPELREQARAAMPPRMLFTVDEAAQQLGIGKTKTYSLVRSGELESVQIGRLRRIHIDSIRAYADQLVSSQSANRNVA